MIETKRLKIYAASKEQMEACIAAQSDEILKEAYTEMLDGCLTHPDQWEWYAIWMIDLKDGTHVGDLCFKGLSGEGTAEIGYGIEEEHQGHGYATEAVTALVDWALNQPGVTCITAETEETNIASKRVLNKAGFAATGENGEEGPLFARRITIRPEEHTMLNKKIRQYIGLIAAALAYYLIHEGAHLITALCMGVFKEVRFLGLGMQVDVAAAQMIDLPSVQQVAVWLPGNITLCLCSVALAGR